MHGGNLDNEIGVAIPDRRRWRLQFPPARLISNGSTDHAHVHLSRRSILEIQAESTAVVRILN